MRSFNIQMICLLVLMLAHPALAQTFGRALQQSHIEANEPELKKFPQLLQRDLVQYFHRIYGKPIQVTGELLRAQATQTGVAFPKYYAWVWIYDKTKLLAEGAVRVAAVEKTHFEVTDFLSTKAIVKEPTAIYEVFPALLCPEILKRSGLTGPSI